MCLAQGPQHSDAGEARTHGPSVSSQALFLWATVLPTKLTRACSHGAPSQIPTLKFFDSASTPQFHPGAWPWQQNENSVQYVFYLLFVRTHTKFGIKIFEIDMLMIFDLLTSPQGHQFDPRMKMLLAFCLARHPPRFDMLHDHVCKNRIVWPPGYPKCPKVPPLGHDPGDRIKILSDMFCIFHLWKHTQNLALKSLKLTW